MCDAKDVMTSKVYDDVRRPGEGLSNQTISQPIRVSLKIFMSKGSNRGPTKGIWERELVFLFGRRGYYFCIQKSYIGSGNIESSQILTMSPDPR